MWLCDQPGDYNGIRKTLWEYDTENHTENSNHSEKPLKLHWKALHKKLALKCSLWSHWNLPAIVIQEC